MDLFDPGSGSQTHDLNGGIAPSGLFWTVAIPNNSAHHHGNTVTLHLEDLQVLDSFQFLGSTEVPATVSLDVAWTAAEDFDHVNPSSSDPTDPGNFAGNFHVATATGTFSGSTGDFSFSGTGTSEGRFAEFGHERNGTFVGVDLAASCPGAGSASGAPVAVGPAGVSSERGTAVAVVPNGSSAEVTLDLAEPSRVSANVYDVTGRRVATLLDDANLPAGEQSLRWSLRDGAGRRVRSGLYFLRWQTPTTAGASRIVVMP